jgi:outer membrane scaffolding protein for murein synthesis (MipA/OmpV family)
LAGLESIRQILVGTKNALQYFSCAYGRLIDDRRNSPLVSRRSKSSWATQQ